MSFITRRKRRGGGAAPPSAPVIADQTLDYGKKYLTTSATTKRYGAVTPTGSGWTSLTVNSGNAAGDLEINTTTGVINASPNGRDTGMSGSPYTLNITFTNAYGNTTVDITVRFTGTDSNGVNLANAWSVASNTEARAVAESAALTYGDTIYLRSGDYNQTQADNRWIRSATTAGTWNGYGVANNAWMADNWIVIRPHYGASPIIYYVGLRPIGGDAGSWRFRWKDLTFVDSQVYTTAFSGTGLLNILSEAGVYCSDIWVDTCTFTRPVNTDFALKTKSVNGVGGSPGTRAVAITGGRIKVTNCTMTRCNNSIWVGGPDCYIVGNTSIGQVSDVITAVSPHTNMIINFNTARGYTEAMQVLPVTAVTLGASTIFTVSLTDVVKVAVGWNMIVQYPDDSRMDGQFRTSPASVNNGTGEITLAFNSTGWNAYSGSGCNLYCYTSHSDFCQLDNAGGSLGDFDDIEFVGNQILINPTATQYTQGVAGLQAPVSGAVYYRRLYARGNYFIGKQSNALNFGQCQDSDVSWNTVIDFPDYTGLIKPSSLTPTIVATTGTGNVTKYNIANAYSVASSTQTDNKTVTRGVTDLATLFTNPVGLLASSIDAPVDYGLLAGSTWQLQAIQPGAGAYVDFTNQTTNFPDEQAGGQTFTGGFDNTFVGGFNG